MHQQQWRWHYPSTNQPLHFYQESRVLITPGGRRTTRPKQRWLKQLPTQEGDGYPWRRGDLRRTKGRGVTMCLFWRLQLGVPP